MLVALQEKSEKHDRKMKQHIEDITINLDDITCFFSYANRGALQENKRALYKYNAIRGQTAYVDRKSTCFLPPAVLRKSRDTARKENN